jgi:hypothetical protein
MHDAADEELEAILHLCRSAGKPSRLNVVSSVQRLGVRLATVYAAQIKGR